MTKDRTGVEPEAFPEIFGMHFYVRQSETLLALGKYRVTRGSLATQLRISNTLAVRNFARACERLKITSVAELWATKPIAFAETVGCGLTTLHVAVRVLVAHGYPVKTWYNRGGDSDGVTFSTLKDHVHKRGGENTAATVTPSLDTPQPVPPLKKRRRLHGAHSRERSSTS